MAEYLEKHPFFETQGITGKFLNELAERIDYLFVEPDEDVIKIWRPHEAMYLILDGRINFTFDLLDSRVRERHIAEMARDL